MTNTSVRVISPSAGPFPAPIPRPRRVKVDRIQPAPELSVQAATSDPRLSSRRPSARLAIWLDTTLALALACTAAAVGSIPAQLALVSAVIWPLLLLGVGHYRQPLHDVGRGARLWLVIGTGARAAVTALALSPWLPTFDLIAIAELVAVFTVASSVLPLVGVGPRRVRIVLAGRPRDVREVILELRTSDRHEVVAACLTRTSKESLGDLPTYVGLDSSADVAHRHEAEA